MTYVMMRPRSMEGGDLSWIWVSRLPYSLNTLMHGSHLSFSTLSHSFSSSNIRIENIYHHQTIILLLFQRTHTNYTPPLITFMDGLPFIQTMVSQWLKPVST